ncbi:MAG: MATE family efflux transporter [Clostridiales bacterium]|nr:MATE family efflux transporter [Clostridiales bacterium]
MAKSMVSGKPLSLMLQFATPLLLGNLLQQTYNIIDAAIVGQMLGDKALAGVGASSSIQFLVLGFCMGCCAGFGVPVAKYFGANDMHKMRKYIFNGAVLTGIIAIVVTVICSVGCNQILHLLSVPQDIYDKAYSYLIVIFLGIPFTLMYNYLSSVLRSLGDSRTPFMFLAFSAVLNIFLDLFCILVLKWGCAGAAIATITAQAVSGILCLVYIFKKVQVMHLETQDRIVEGSAVKELLIMGIPTGLQFSITAIGSMVMQSANNGLGSVYVSGFTAGMRIKQFTMCPFDAFATAASVFCSQNLGAGQAKRIKQGLLQAIAVAVGYGLIAGLIMILFGRPLSMIFVKKSAVDVLDASAKYLRYMGFFYWSLGILNVARMVTQGLGYSGRAIFSGVTEMAARIIVSLGFVGTFGFTAICFADQTAWVTATIYILPTCLYCVKKSTAKIAAAT